MNQRISTHEPDASPVIANIKAALRDRPGTVLGITLGLGAVLGALIVRRDKGILLDLMHLAVRIALTATKTAT